MKNFKVAMLAAAALLVGRVAMAGTVKYVAPPGTALPTQVSTVNEGTLTSDAYGVVTITQCVQATGATPTPVSNCDFGNLDAKTLVSAGWAPLSATAFMNPPVTVAKLPACVAATSIDGALMTVSNNVAPCPAPSNGATPKATATAYTECLVRCNGDVPGWVVVGY